MTENHWDRLRKGPIDRSDFLRITKDVAKAAIGASLVPSLPLEKSQVGKIRANKTAEYRYNELLKQPLEPNGHVGMTDLSKIPSELFTHFKKERLSRTVNFNLMYDQDTKAHPNHLQLGTPGEYEYEVWQGVKKAIGDGQQQVYITIELPGSSNTDVNLTDWKKYVGEIASQFKGATFIIGNELNDSQWWLDKLDLYAQQYIAAADTIKENAPSSKRLIYGEAYTGDGSMLDNALDKIKVLAQVNGRTVEDVVDGVPFHFYDRASRFPLRVETYQAIARKYELPEKLYLTELGRAEQAELSDDMESELVVQNLAMGLSLVSEGKIEDVIWYAAYALPKNDPRGHSLSAVNNDGSVVSLKPAFSKFWEVSKLLHHDVTRQDVDNVTIIRGKTSMDDGVLIAWNSDEPLLYKGLFGRLLALEFWDEPDYKKLSLESLGITGSDLFLDRSRTFGVEGRVVMEVFPNSPNLR